MSSQSGTPPITEKILRWLLPDDDLDTPVGDFAELFHQYVDTHGIRYARWRYRGQVAGMIPGRLISKIYWRVAMIRSYLRSAVRNLRRHVTYSFTNVVGLACGMACFLLIALFVRSELAVDSFHADAESIYRITRTAATADDPSIVYSSVPYGLGDMLRDDFPAVADIVRVLAQRQVILSVDTDRFYEGGMILTEPSFFDIFTFRTVSGSTEKALARPDGLIISEQIAEKYFGDANPVGKTMLINNEHLVTIGAVVEDVPTRSSIQFSLVGPLDAPYGTRARLAKFRSGEWNPSMYTTYFRLEQGASAEKLNQRLTPHLTEYAPVDISYVTQMRNGEAATFQAEPLMDTYLASASTNLIGPTGNGRLLLIFSTAALLVLVLASVNFTNLATARSIRRSREVGMRKVVGASRSQVGVQFLAESILMSMLALPPAVFMVSAVLPWFNDVIQTSLGIDFGGDFGLYAWLLATAAIVGVASGMYPAFFMARMKPTLVLTGSAPDRRRGLGLRRSLVVIQFVISTVLIVGTVSIQRQLDFMQTSDLGLEPDQIMVIPISGTDAAENINRFKEQLLSTAGVSAASLSNDVPTRAAAGLIFMPKRKSDVETKSITVDKDFLKTYDISLIDGVLPLQRPDSAEYLPVVVNESGARALAGLDRGPVLSGRFFLGNTDVEVVGIVEDFHFSSMHEMVEPMLLKPMDASSSSAAYLSVKLDTGDIRSTVALLSDQWNEVAPTFPFDYFFLDDAFRQLYRAENRLGHLFSAFSLFALFIACLGLYGLAAFTAEQRTREVGVRRVLGATTGQIVGLLSGDFLRLILLAVVVAFPIALLLVEQWSQEFAYRTGLPWTIILLSATGAILLAMVAVALQGLRAAHADPVHSLRQD